MLDSSNQLHPAAALHPPAEHIPADGFDACPGAELACDVFRAELDVAVRIRGFGTHVTLILFRTTRSAKLEAALQCHHAAREQQQTAIVVAGAVHAFAVEGTTLQDDIVQAAILGLGTDVTIGRQRFDDHRELRHLHLVLVLQEA